MATKSDVGQSKTEIEDVGALVDWSTRDLLWGQPRNGTHQRSGAGESTFLENAAETEVRHFDPFGSDENVRRFEIAMHDARRMDFPYSIDKPRCHEPQQRPLDPATVGYEVFQGLPFDVIHDEMDEWPVVDDLVDSSRMDTCHGHDPPSFSGEPIAKSLLIGQVRSQDLDRETLSLGVLCQKDNAQSSGSESPQHAIRAELRRITRFQFLHVPSPVQ
jgi:hypothetical protein